MSEEHVYHIGFYTILYIQAYLWSWHTWPAAKEATYYMGVNVQSNRWTGSILRLSLYDLIDRHWFLRRYLVVFKVSFCNEVVTPGVTATSALTSAECQCHTSSIWPWSGMPKVRVYNTFLGGLRQLYLMSQNSSTKLIASMSWVEGPFLRLAFGFFWS